MGCKMMPSSMLGTMFVSSEAYPAICNPNDQFHHMTQFFSDVMAQGMHPYCARSLFTNYRSSVIHAATELECLGYTI